MSYANGTTHYNLPQTVGSDKRDWFDTNESFQAVDTALFGASQGISQVTLDIASINSDIQTITGKQTADEADITILHGKVSTLETTVNNQAATISDDKRDLQDNIESLKEDTATSTRAYNVGDYFYYNDVLYRATTAIAIGATIVPNTNCTGVTVMSELKNPIILGSVLTDGIKTWGMILNELYAFIPADISTLHLAFNAMRCTGGNASGYEFSNTFVTTDGSAIYTDTYYLRPNNSKRYRVGSDNIVSDITNTVPNAGATMYVCII